MITDKPSDLPIALAKIGGVKPPTPPTSARPCVLFVALIFRNGNLLILDLEGVINRSWDERRQVK